MQQEMAILPIGTIIQGRYVVEELLGKGGFGAVYRVRDGDAQGELFAVKELIDPSRQEQERLARECELLRPLEHEALPRVYRVIDDAQYTPVPATPERTPTRVFPTSVPGGGHHGRHRRKGGDGGGG